MSWDTTCLTNMVELLIVVLPILWAVQVFADITLDG